MNAKRRTSFKTALLPLIVLPLLVQSHAAQAADPEMDACISAFVSTNLQKDQPVKIRRIDSAASPVDPHSRSSIVLTATAKSGKPLASATCVVTDKEVVLTMEGAPATRRFAQADATMRSR